MPHTWLRALEAYRYLVKLADFADAANYPGWFQYSSVPGDRDSTASFENHFRDHAQTSTKAWLEVVYWKLYSQPQHRDRITRRVANHFTHESVAPSDLYHACAAYIGMPVRENFDAFRRLFGFTTPAIAIAATFPAFLMPQTYPMVDTRIAKWVGACLTEHNVIDPAGPQLCAAPFLKSRRTNLTMADFAFMRSWTAWCNYTATKLSAKTDRAWRARDVEMAVFYAWGNRGRRHPMHPLNPIGPNTV